MNEFGPKPEDHLEDVKEQGVEYGTDVAIRDMYFRHGDKKGEDLSDVGREQAGKIGEALVVSEDGIKPYGSELKRSRDFSQIIVESAPISGEQKKYTLRQRLDLGDQRFWKKEFLNSFGAMQKEKGPDATMQWFIDHGDQAPKGNDISPEEMAARFGHHVLRRLEMPTRLKSGSRVDLVNTSHGSLIEPFLKEAIGNSLEKDPINPDGKTFIEQLGGAFKVAEGFEIDTKLDDEGNRTSVLKLRDKEYPINEAHLTELTEKYDEKWRKERDDKNIFVRLDATLDRAEQQLNASRGEGSIKENFDSALDALTALVQHRILLRDRTGSNEAAVEDLILRVTEYRETFKTVPPEKQKEILGHLQKEVEGKIGEVQQWRSGQPRVGEKETGPLI